MHLFECALRDLRNLEHFCSEQSVVLVQDCYPANATIASRMRRDPRDAWAGDVWKLIICLKEYRPELHVSTIAVAPTGLGAIRGLDPLRSLAASLGCHVSTVVEADGPVPSPWR